ncbi:MAG: DUF374 domain-containing protein [Deltaproteobacteria bacterium]|nr:DUF374 domain-containing protein [Deltaproteobacteria bacterium]
MHFTRKNRLKKIQISVLAWLATFVIRILRWTWRVQIEHLMPLPRNEHIVFCFWHGSQAAMLAYHHFKPIAVLSSLSQDGTLQAKILARLGYTVCRGSSSRGGGAGLKAMIRCIKKDNCDGAFTVDGPRGPYHTAKPGALAAARQSNALLVPAVSFATQAWIFRKAWDKYTLPKPFSRVIIRTGNIMSPDDLDTRLLTAALNELNFLNPES